ncbi:MAG TPA: DUF2946 domain-containing protein [Noviherbaspirillum sp.]|nr:DUF2946 domain-containing protein [Noviherbaspirillum sp.]
MFLTRKTRGAWAWAVMFAVLFNIALPVATAMRADGRPVSFAEICTTSGTKQVVLQDAGSGQEEKHVSLLHDGHCTLCVIQLASCMLTGEAGALPIQARQAYVLNATSQSTPSQHFSFRTPPSQAPPPFS